MSSIEANKAVAAVLLASIAAMLVGITADALYKPQAKISKRGYQIETKSDQGADTTIAHNAESDEIDIAGVMKLANAEAGREVLKKCVSCHSIDQSKANRIGPYLWDIVGRAKASAEGYKYSSAMQSKGGNWDEESLFRFLHKPNKFVPGTKMSFVGLNKFQDIANLIAFLKTFASDDK
jgi:cytochrome c